MLILAWCVLILFTLGTLMGAHRRISEGESFPNFIATLCIQASVIWCLIYLILLL